MEQARLVDWARRPTSAFFVLAAVVATGLVGYGSAQVTAAPGPGVATIAAERTTIDLSVELRAYANGSTAVSVEGSPNFPPSPRFPTYAITLERDGELIFADSLSATGRLSYQDQFLDPETTYSYEFIATSGGRNARKRVAVTPLSWPTDLVAISISYGWIELQWKDQSDYEDGYEVLRRAEGQDWCVVARTPANSQYLRDLQVEGGTPYTYYVRAFSAEGVSGQYDAMITASATAPSNGLRAPDALAAVASSSSHVRLTWHDNSPDDYGFEIERAEPGLSGGTPDTQVPMCLFERLGWVGRGSTTFLDRTTQINREYLYRVRGFAPTGFSHYTSAVTVRVLAAPTGLVAATLSSGAIQLGWRDMGPLEAGYQVERRAGTGAFAPLVTVEDDPQRFTDTNLTAETEYVYRVRAFAPNSVSDWSRTAGAPVLAGPAGSLRIQVLSDSRARLTWSDRSGFEAGYQIERHTPAMPAGVFDRLGAVGVNGTTFTDSTLSASTTLTPTTYSYRVCAYTAKGISSYSNTVSATPVLSAPTALTARVVSGRVINLAWKDTNAGEEGFEIECSSDAARTFHLIGRTAGDVLKYSTSVPEENATYFFRVRAIGSRYSNVVRVIVLATPLLKSAFAASPTQIDLSWSDLSLGETAFTIERPTSSGEFREVRRAGANTTTIADIGLLPGTTYVYRMRAYNESGFTRYSNQITVDTPP